MQAEEKQDLSISIILGGILGGILVAFSQDLPHLGLNDQYVIVQLVALGLLVGSMPIRAYFGTSPQGILVPSAVSVTGGIVLIAMVASTIGISHKIIAVVAWIIGGAVNYVGFSSALVPDLALHLATIIIAAWVLSFGVILLLGLLLGGAATMLVGVVSVAVIICFVVVFDSIAAEMDTFPTLP